MFNRLRLRKRSNYVKNFKARHHIHFYTLSYKKTQKIDKTASDSTAKQSELIKCIYERDE